MDFDIDQSRLEMMTSLFGEVIENSQVEVTPHGFSVDQINNSKTIILQAEAHPDLFESWTSEEHLISVDWQRWNEITGALDPGRIAVSLEDERGQIEMTDSGGFDYSMTTITIPNLEDGDAPEVTGDLSCDVQVSELVDAIDKCELASGMIHFEVREGDRGENQLWVWSSGDTDSAEIPLTTVSPDIPSVHTLFRSQILNQVLDKIPGDEVVTLEFTHNGGRGNGKNHPMRLIGGLWDDSFSLEAYFAPQQR